MHCATIRQQAERKMDSQLIKELRGEWHQALSALETVLDERPGEHIAEISQAVCSLIRVRDKLIDVNRTEGLSTEGKQHLCQTNAMLSVVASLEYPLAGLRWQRVKLVHDGLTQMLGSTREFA